MLADETDWRYTGGILLDSFETEIKLEMIASIFDK